MQVHRTASAVRRRAVAGLSTLALGLGTVLVATAPAQAAQDVEASASASDGAIGWGFKESFRRYVGNQTAALPPIGALPTGERITLRGAAAFDTDGTPASPNNTSTPNETLPYLLPVTGGAVESADDLRIQTGGGFEYHFPSHYFEILVENVALVVTDGTATVVADVTAEVTGDFGDWQAGTYGGEGVTIATVGSVDVDLTDDAVSVAASGLALTAAGAEALPLYPEGDPLDDLTLTAGLAPAAAPELDPQITVSKSSGLDAEGETITVQGSGFDPAANTASRPPVTVGQPTGVYVVFGSFAETWRPSAGAPSSARSVISQKWAIPEPSFTQVGTQYPSQAPQLVELAADGTFTVELLAEELEDASGVYGVYTYAAGGAAANAAQELTVPVSFAGADGGAGDIPIDVTVPEVTDPEPEPEPGEFVWTIGGGSGAVSLGTAAVDGGAFVADGALKQVTVTDTRAGQPAWTINGSVGEFVAGDRSFSGSFLGWTPAVSQNTVGAVAGDAVVAGTGGGLTASSTLAWAPAGHAKGSATVDAALALELPLDTEAGDYTGVLTLTAVG
ncbi:HtaA domain-containing protein [Oerskovia flava]|uniref:HtaA domain-containing protein n=1 Tax=Oerskovia flava TaxID=2986422 RepID=UPI00223F5085|nr:HtaA domain-containing protein [Oerskovia sp. JB1-3-2]